MTAASIPWPLLAGAAVVAWWLLYAVAPGGGVAGRWLAGLLRPAAHRAIAAVRRAGRAWLTYGRTRAAAMAAARRAARPQHRRRGPHHPHTHTTIPGGTR